MKPAPAGERRARCARCAAHAPRGSPCSTRRALSPADRARIRELGAAARPSSSPSAILLALPATLGAHAAAQLLERAGARCGPNALVVTHADETDQIGVAVEAACRFDLAPEYMLERGRAGGWRLSRLDPAGLAARCCREARVARKKARQRCPLPSCPTTSCSVSARRSAERHPRARRSSAAPSALVAGDHRADPALQPARSSTGSSSNSRARAGACACGGTARSAEPARARRAAHRRPPLGRGDAGTRVRAHPARRVRCSSTRPASRDADAELHRRRERRRAAARRPGHARRSASEIDLPSHAHSQDAPPVTGSGRVVRIDVAGPARRSTFIEISDLDRRRLVRFIFECQRAERRRGLDGRTAVADAEATIDAPRRPGRPGSCADPEEPRRRRREQKPPSRKEQEGQGREEGQDRARSRGAPARRRPSDRRAPARRALGGARQELGRARRASCSAATCRCRRTPSPRPACVRSSPGLVCYVAAWAGAVFVWRRLVVLEIKAREAAAARRRRSRARALAPGGPQARGRQPASRTAA